MIFGHVFLYTRNEIFFACFLIKVILIKVTFLAEVNYSTYSFSLYMPSNAINNDILKY